MNKLLFALPLLALGCGGLKNTNPLQSLAGPTDSARYSFEASSMGWVSIPAPASSVDNVYQSAQMSFFGQGSLGFHVTSMGNVDGDAARIGVTPAVMPDLSGKTISAWVYLPASAAPSDSLPTYAQIIVWDGAGTPVYANSVGVNLSRDGWTHVTWSPIANSSGSVINDGRGYIDVGFNPVSISKIGLKFGCAGASGSFTYTGDLFIDSVDW